MNIENEFKRSYYHEVFKFDIEFVVSGSSIKKSKGNYLFNADGYVQGTFKFKAIAVFGQDEKFIRFEKIKDIFDRDWLTENSLEIISEYEPGELTLRGLHYQLVGRGMINHTRLYKRACSAMVEARREGLVHYEVFSDYEREMLGETRFQATDVDESIDLAKEEIKNWMKYYYKNRWENQEYYLEVFIEKKALIGQFKKTCQNNRVALGACKGYPSLTFLNETSKRFAKAQEEGKKLVILYFGDYDPSGEDIPRSIEDNLRNDFGVNVKADRIALMEDQVVEWELPPAPTKQGDSRSGSWDGLGQVELDAVDPKKLKQLTQEAIDKYFDQDLKDELDQQEEVEKKQYQSELKEYVNNLKIEDDE